MLRGSWDPGISYYAFQPMTLILFITNDHIAPIYIKKKLIFVDAMRPQYYNQASIDQARHIHHSATSTKSATSTASGMSNTSGPGFTSMCVACVAAAAVVSTGECGSAVLRAALCGCTWHYSRPVRVQRVMYMQREGRIHVRRWG